MDSPLNASDVTVGLHPNGYKIDKTASAMNRYTKWEITENNQWKNPKPICFDSMPQEGWIAADKFDWGKSQIEVSLPE